MDRKNESTEYLYLNGRLVYFAEIDAICIKIVGGHPSYLAPFYRFGADNYHLYVDELAREARRCPKENIYFAVRKYYPPRLYINDVLRLFFEDIDDYYRRVDGSPIKAHE